MPLVRSGRDFYRLATRFDDWRKHGQTRAAEHGAEAECDGRAREHETEHRHHHSHFGAMHARNVLLSGVALIIGFIRSVVVMLLNRGLLASITIDV